MNDRFLWVEFQLDAICAEASDKGIEKALTRVPGDMDATYERILKTINEKPRPKRELARRVLIWTAYARKPLSIYYLALAISIEMDTKSLEDLKSSIPANEFILDACANLISIDGPFRSVRFVHFSVQEFLTSHRSTTLNLGYEMAHREIAQTCIILQTQLPKPGLPKPGLPKQRRLYGYKFIYQYALDEWPHHLLAGNLNNLLVDDQIVTLTLSFFQKGPTLLMKQNDTINDFEEERKLNLKFSLPILTLIFDLPGTQKCRPLYRTHLEEEQLGYYDSHECIVLSNDKLAIHYAIYELDSIPVVQRLHNSGYALDYSYSSLDGQDHRIPECLYLPLLCLVQSVKMARYLLENGISIERGTSDDPLKYFAGKADLVEVFQLVLDRVMDLGDGRLEGALQAAIENHCLGAVRLLLDKGVSGFSEIESMCSNALQAAVYNGKILQLLLNKGPNIDAMGGKYGTALQAAACHGKVKVIELLLDKGANVNADGGEYGTTLQAAACYGRVEVIRLLLGKGADINAMGGEYGTALQAAAYRGSIITRLLLNKGANINAVGGKYGTALQAAAYRGNINIIQLLLYKGANINAVGGKYGTALQAAAYERNRGIIRLLLDKEANVNAEGGEYGTALQAAVYNGSIDVIRLLLNKGANINAVGGRYGNALQTAAVACGDNIKIIQLLLDKGANVNAEGGEYGTALQAAAYEGNGDIILLLLDKGASINAVGGRYGNALQAAATAYGGNIEIIQLLLDKGANVNAEGGEYGTALQAAAYEGNEGIIKLLLDKGASINAVGGRYGNALQAAAYCNNIDTSIIQLLLDNGANINAMGGEYGTALQAAACRGNIGVIRLLLDKGANINAVGGEYGNALQAAAAANDNVKVIRLLLDNEANINAMDGGYCNALQVAACHGNIEVIQLLLEKGADVNAPGDVLGTALHAAAYGGKIDVARLLLLEKGADVNAPGGIFGTALQAAAYGGNIYVIRLLLYQGADINARVGKYGAALKRMLALNLVDQGQKVPGDIPLLVELLHDYAPLLMQQLPESEYEKTAKRLVKPDRCSLHVFRKLLESRGWKGEAQSSEEEEEEEESDGNRTRNENSQEQPETPNERSLKAIVHVWKLFGLIFVVFLLYTFIPFWGV